MSTARERHAFAVNAERLMDGDKLPPDTTASALAPLNLAPHRLLALPTLPARFVYQR
jgi:hypothetical protein